jgi:hypothetical protein
MNKEPCLRCPLGLYCLEHGFDVRIVFCAACQNVLLSLCYSPSQWLSAPHTPLDLLLTSGSAAWLGPLSPAQAAITRIEMAVPKTCPRRFQDSSRHETSAYPCPENRGKEKHG